MTNDQTADPRRARLPASSAFVVHLAPTPHDAAEPVEGRIEHITSGEAMRFSSSAELIAFMRHVVRQNG